MAQSKGEAASQGLMMTCSHGLEDELYRRGGGRGNLLRPRTFSCNGNSEALGGSFRLRANGARACPADGEGWRRASATGSRGSPRAEELQGQAFRPINRALSVSPFRRGTSSRFSPAATPRSSRFRTPGSSRSPAVLSEAQLPLLFPFPFLFFFFDEGLDPSAASGRSNVKGLRLSDPC